MSPLLLLLFLLYKKREEKNNKKKKGKNEKERCQWKVLKAKGAKWEIGLGKNLNFWKNVDYIKIKIKKLSRRQPTK